MIKQVGETGLVKLLQLINAKFYTKADTEHNQASNTINAMTGYTKASSAGAVSAEDSLNTAVGKIEKSLDNCVNLSGEQTITGVKTFSGHIILASGIELY